MLVLMNLTPGTMLIAYADGHHIGEAEIEANEGQHLTVLLHHEGGGMTWYRLAKNDLNHDRSFHLEDCVVLQKE